jgi:hypothetical protein
MNNLCLKVAGHGREGFAGNDAAFSRDALCSGRDFAVQRDLVF